MLYCCNFSLFSQEDSIFLKNKEVITGKVEKITNKKVIFRGKNYVQYELSHRKIHGINYNSGEKEYLFIENEQREKKREALAQNFGRHLISTNLFSITFLESLEFDYEYFFPHGELSLMATSQLALSNQYTNRLYSGGIDLHYYPTAQGTVRYFVGLGSELGSYREGDPISFIKKPYSDVLYYYARVSNGILLQVTPNFNISCSLLTGYRQNHKSANFHREFFFKYKLGYRF
jgi:hypothetical protein